MAFLIPLQANAEHLKCDLALNLIEDANSSETKQLLLDIDLSSTARNLMTGAMISTSCFNKITEIFHSNSSIIEMVINGDLSYGTLKNADINIGQYNYQLNLNFARMPDSSGAFIATGKMTSLNNTYFIHQNAEGKCNLSD